MKKSQQKIFWDTDLISGRKNSRQNFLSHTFTARKKLQDTAHKNKTSDTAHKKLIVLYYKDNKQKHL